jgi:hypothetical protein
MAVVMPAKRRQYSGKLATPIIWDVSPTFEGLVSDERVKEFWKRHNRHQRKVKQRVNKQISEKLSLLMEFYGIANKNDMGALALALATEHVPGFKVLPQGGKKRGRKKMWDGPNLQALLQAVLTVKEKHRFTDRQALHFISENDEYAVIWGPPVSYRGSKRQWVETLESRLQDAKRYGAFVESFFADFGRNAQKFRKK